MNKMQKGVNNLITDVPGVKVGHWTCKDGDHQTGVTVVIPGENNPFISKLTAAAFVLNGFGKSQGLVQIEELGTLETPIALTGTLNVGKVHDAMVEYMFLQAEKNNYSIWTVNPIVSECNDAYLNDVRERAIGQKEVFEAIDMAAYSKKTFGMFAGEEKTVRLLCDNSMIGVIVDEFGTEVAIRKEDEEHIMARMDVAVSPQFFGWLAGLGDRVEIIAPADVREEYKAYLAKIISCYNI